MNKKTLSACEKCFHKCKAQCCTFVPLPKNFIEKHINDIQREILEFYPFEIKGYYYPVVKITEKLQDGKVVKGVNTDEQICPFLKEDKSCAVYNDRPYICRSFGTKTEKYHFLTCKIQQGYGKYSGFIKDSEDYNLQNKYSITKYFFEFNEHFKKILKDLNE